MKLPKKYVVFNYEGEHGFLPARDADDNCLYFDSLAQAAAAMKDGWATDEELLAAGWAESLDGRSCPYCGGPVFPSYLDLYTAQCFDCDEDFFDFEVTE